MLRLGRTDVSRRDAGDLEASLDVLTRKSKGLARYVEAVNAAAAADADDEASHHTRSTQSLPPFRPVRHHRFSRTMLAPSSPTTQAAEDEKKTFSPASSAGKHRKQRRRGGPSATKRLAATTDLSALGFPQRQRQPVPTADGRSGKPLTLQQRVSRGVASAEELDELFEEFQDELLVRSHEHAAVLSGLFHSVQVQRDELSKERDEARSRVDTLEKEVAQLREKLRGVWSKASQEINIVQKQHERAIRTLHSELDMVRDTSQRQILVAEERSRATALSLEAFHSLYRALKDDIRATAVADGGSTRFLVAEVTKLKRERENDEKLIEAYEERVQELHNELVYVQTHSSMGASNNQQSHKQRQEEQQRMLHSKDALTRPMQSASLTTLERVSATLSSVIAKAVGLRPERVPALLVSVSPEPVWILSCVKGILDDRIRFEVMASLEYPARVLPAMGPFVYAWFLSDEDRGRNRLESFMVGLVHLAEKEPAVNMLVRMLSGMSLAVTSFTLDCLVRLRFRKTQSPKAMTVRVRRLWQRWFPRHDPLQLSRTLPKDPDVYTEALRLATYYRDNKYEADRKRQTEQLRERFEVLHRAKGHDGSELGDDGSSALLFHVTLDEFCDVLRSVEPGNTTLLMAASLFDACRSFGSFDLLDFDQFMRYCENQQLLSYCTHRFSSFYDFQDDPSREEALSFSLKRELMLFDDQDDAEAGHDSSDPAAGQDRPGGRGLCHAEEHMLRLSIEDAGRDANRKLWAWRRLSLHHRRLMYASETDGEFSSSALDKLIRDIRDASGGSQKKSEHLERVVLLINARKIARHWRQYRSQKHKRLIECGVASPFWPFFNDEAMALLRRPVTETTADAAPSSSKPSRLALTVDTNENIVDEHKNDDDDKEEEEDDEEEEENTEEGLVEGAVLTGDDKELEWVHTRIRHIYWYAVRVLDERGLQVPFDFTKTVVDYLYSCYGSRELALRGLAELMAGVMRFASVSTRVRVFGLLVGAPAAVEATAKKRRGTMRHVSSRHSDEHYDPRVALFFLCALRRLGVSVLNDSHATVGRNVASRLTKECFALVHHSPTPEFIVRLNRLFKDEEGGADAMSVDALLEHIGFSFRDQEAEALQRLEEAIAARDWQLHLEVPYDTFADEMLRMDPHLPVMQLPAMYRAVVLETRARRGRFDADIVRDVVLEQHHMGDWAQLLLASSPSSGGGDEMTSPSSDGGGGGGAWNRARTRLRVVGALASRGGSAGTAKNNNNNNKKKKKAEGDGTVVESNPSPSHNINDNSTTPSSSVSFEGITLDWLSIDDIMLREAWARHEAGIAATHEVLRRRKTDAGHFKQVDALREAFAGRLHSRLGQSDQELTASTLQRSWRIFRELMSQTLALCHASHDIFQFS